MVMAHGLRGCIQVALSGCWLLRLHVNSYNGARCQND